MAVYWEEPYGHNIWRRKNFIILLVHLYQLLGPESERKGGQLEDDSTLKNNKKVIIHIKFEDFDLSPPVHVCNYSPDLVYIPNCT